VPPAASVVAQDRQVELADAIGLGGATVEAHPRDDRRQPTAEVLDSDRAGGAEVEP
jgi:hypothetical protein